MKKILLFAAIVAGILIFPLELRAQCTPGDETTCPDPENNGEICPEVLPNAILDESYSQEFTILAPPEYIVDSTAGIVFALHHLTLQSIENMPPGLSWVTNAEEDVFMVGTYYCVLLEGTPTMKGSFPLKIVVDVYVPGILGSPPIYVATVADSTSLTINVTDPSGTADLQAGNLSRMNCSPNPFQEDIEVTFLNAEAGDASFEVYSLMGKQVHSEAVTLQQGENRIFFDGRGLMAGIYFVTIRHFRGILTHRIVKSN